VVFGCGKHDSYPDERKIQEVNCVNNLKQLGLAFHNYESTYKQFPITNVLNSDGTGSAAGTTTMTAPQRWQA